MDFSHWSSFTLPTVLKKLKLKGCEREDMETRQHSSREEGYGERRGDKKKQIRDAEKQHFVQLDSLPTSRDTIDTRDVSVYELGLAVVDCHYF